MQTTAVVPRIAVSNCFCSELLGRTCCASDEDRSSLHVSGRDQLVIYGPKDIRLGTSKSAQVGCCAAPTTLCEHGAPVKGVSCPPPCVAIRGDAHDGLAVCRVKGLDVTGSRSCLFG